MKKILSILMLAALCANAQTTFTNGVKISALPQVSSISGTEIVVLNQSGTTKTATAAQLIAADVSLINSVTNGLAAMVATNAARDLVASNSLAALVATNAAADLVSSNAMKVLITANTAGDVTASNYFATVTAANAAANVATSNSISGAATAAAAAAVAPLASNAITNGGNAIFGNLNFTPLIVGNVPATYFLNLSNASFQSITYTNTSGNSNLQLTNWAAGQSVTVFIKNQTGSAQTYVLPNYFQTNVFNLTANANTINSIPNGRVIVFNFVVLSPSQVYMSYANGY